MCKRLRVGDKVWFIRTWERSNLKSCTFSKNPLRYPIQKKICQVVETNRGILYQVKDGHFHESLLGVVVFKDYEEACVRLICDNLIRGDVVVLVKDILKLPSGLYFGKNDKGKDIIIQREVGYGFTYKVDEGKPCLRCIDYDEKGNIESSYPECRVKV